MSDAMQPPTDAEQQSLLVMYERLENCRADYNGLLAAVAERTGFRPASLRQWVKALADDKLDEAIRSTTEVVDLMEAKRGEGGER
jgi:transposase-like protein